METKIEILYCDKHPLEKIGRLAGICWNAPLDDIEKNAKRAIDCIKATHWRVLEFVEVTVLIQGFSARAMRELYTHIGGSPTRLQESTRYVAESGFEYYTPSKIAAYPETEMPYTVGMSQIQESYNALLERGVAKEDAANLLPLGMHSKMVWKVNLRTLVNFFNRRLCMRALKEIRDLAGLLRDTLASIDDDWKFLSDSLFVPMCEIYKWRNPALCFCQETRGCGRYKSIEDVRIAAAGSAESGDADMHKSRCVGMLDAFDISTIQPFVDNMAIDDELKFSDGRGRYLQQIFLRLVTCFIDSQDIEIKLEDLQLMGARDLEQCDQVYITATCRHNGLSRRALVAKLLPGVSETDGRQAWHLEIPDVCAKPITAEQCVLAMKTFLESLPWGR